MPEVTVIVATYNCSRVLKCSLQSLLDQSYQDFEAWIIGDCCTDDSEAVVSAFGDPRFHWTNLPQRFGHSYGPHNEGLRRAQGKYIAYLGHDDLWFPWHLATLVKTIEQTQADFAYAAVVLVGPAGPVCASGAAGAKAYAHRSSTSPSSWFHRRAIVEQCGEWPRPEDYAGSFQSLAASAGLCLVASEEFSVIKFPAYLWGIYSLADGHPQPEYLSRMEAHPHRLLQELLSPLALRAVDTAAMPTVGQGLRTAYRAIKWRILDWYGVDRWPVSRYLIRRTAHSHKKTLAQRGLPDA